MTHHPIKTLPDGTRVYSNGTRYKPKSATERKYRVRKIEDPRAYFWHGEWYLLWEMAPDADRVMPETRPDTDAYDHAEKKPRCKCRVCKRPEALRWREKRLRELALL